MSPSLSSVANCDYACAMSKIGFWEAVLGDVGYFERQAINDNAEGMSMILGSQAAGDEFLSGQTRKLFALDMAQSKELARLRTMVRVLSEAVTELGFDRDRLATRMDDALDDLESEKTMRQGSFNPDGSGPYRSGTASQAEEPRTTCTVCKTDVLLRRSNITENGQSCDRCFYAR